MGKHEDILSDIALDKAPAEYHNCPACGGAGDRGGDGALCETCNGIGIIYESQSRAKR